MLGSLALFQLSCTIAILLLVALRLLTGRPAYLYISGVICGAQWFVALYFLASFIGSCCAYCCGGAL